MKFSAIYKPTTLFSLKDSNATNSGAKTLFLPSPYAVKMAILNQAITIGNIDFEGKKNEYFEFISKTKIDYFIDGGFCVNNTFVKILKPERVDGKSDESDEGENKSTGFSRTVAFREYLHLTSRLELIFEYSANEMISEERWKRFLQSYLFKINYFGKRGCFFQFEEFRDNPTQPNVIEFDPRKLGVGILQPYDDFDDQATFEMVSNFSEKVTKRKVKILLLPLKPIGSSKGYKSYYVR